LRKLLDDNGLATVGTHTALITLQAENLQKTIDLHKTLGNRRLICPYMQAKTAENWVALAKQFTDIAAKAKEQDMVIGYHSHAGDFNKFDDGRTPWEIFFDNTPKELIHQIDLGNTLSGGGDPMAMVKRYPGRTKTAHIKEHGGAPDAAIGEGKIDWKSTLETLETTGGIECYIVEHETGKDPLERIQTCLANLRKMGR
jgi:sugar phosphate isomerase/epimerase